MARRSPALRGLSAVLFALVIALPSAASAADKPDATDLQKVRAYVQPSIVYLGAHWEGYVWDESDGEYFGADGAQLFSVDWQCTGYVVNPNGYIATAGHCVNESEGRHALAVEAAKWALSNNVYENPGALDPEQLATGYKVEGEDSNDDKLAPKFTAVWGVTAGGVDASKAYPARVISSQDADKGDAALLKITASQLIPVLLAKHDPVVGRDVVSIGYPASVDAVSDLDYAPSYKDGDISSKKTTGAGLVPSFEISAAMSGGMSGGPTVNLAHQVVGTNSYGINGETQQFNFIRPASLQRELIGAAGVKNTLGTIGTEYVKGLDAYFDGDKKTAVDAFQSIVDEQPSNAMAQEFLRKSKKLSGGAGVLTKLLILGGLIVLAAGGLAAAAFSGNKKANKTKSFASPPGQPLAGPGVPVVLTSPADPEPVAAIEVTEASAQDAAKHQFCVSCGHQLSAGDRFCGGCGTKVAH